jgi:hypothetical protein
MASSFRRLSLVPTLRKAPRSASAAGPSPLLRRTGFVAAVPRATVPSRLPQRFWLSLSIPQALSQTGKTGSGDAWKLRPDPAQLID